MDASRINRQDTMDESLMAGMSSTRTHTERKASTKGRPRRGSQTFSKAHQGSDHTTTTHTTAHPRQPDGHSPDRVSKLRLRNREAAQKCRRRKQRGIEELQNQEVAVEALHDSLLSEASQLQQEVLVLKNMVLDHGGCECSFIEDYIQGAASNLAHQEEGCRVHPVGFDAGAYEAALSGAGGAPAGGGRTVSGQGAPGGHMDMATLSPLALQPAPGLGLRL